MGEIYFTELFTAQLRLFRVDTTLKEFPEEGGSVRGEAGKGGQGSRVQLCKLMAAQKGRARQ